MKEAGTRGRNGSRDYGGILLACLLSPGLLNYLSYSTQVHQLRGGTTRSGLGILISIDSYKKASQTYLQDSYGRKASVEVPSFQVTLACVKLTKINQHIINILSNYNNGIKILANSNIIKGIKQSFPNKTAEELL